METTNTAGSDLLMTINYRQNSMAKVGKKVKQRKNANSQNSSALPINFQVKRIVIPIDFSDYSRQALKYAVTFAEHFKAEVVLVYVIEPVLYPADFSFGQVSLPQLENELRESAQRELDGLVQTQIGGRVPAKTVIRFGKPFLEIIDTAKEEDADLIIISTHGHTGMEHLLFGSTAEKVVRKSTCPVLVVR